MVKESKRKKQKRCQLLFKLGTSFQRIPEWLSLEAICAFPSCSSKVTQTQLPRIGWLLNISKDRDFTTALGNLCQSKMYFLMFRRTFQCFILCLLPLVLTLCTTEMRQVLFSVHTSSRYLYTFLRSLILLYSRLKNISSFSLSLQNRCFNLLIIFMVFQWTLSSMFMPLLYWGAQNWTYHSKCGITSSEQREKILSLDLLAVLCLMQHRLWLAIC